MARNRYATEIKKAEREAREAGNRIRLIGWMRLSIVGAGIAGFILFPWRWASWTVVAVSVGLLLLAVKTHSRWFDKRAGARMRIRYARRRLKAMDLELDGLPTGARYTNPEHPFTYDLDVFGQSSLFSLLDSTATREGADLLAKWLMEPLSVAGDVKERAVAVEELAGKTDFRIDLATAALTAPVGEGGGEESRVEDLEKLAKTGPVKRVLIYLIPLGITALIALSAIGVVDGIWVFYAWLASLIAVGTTARGTGRLHAGLSSSVGSMATAERMSEIIEEREFTSPLLRELKGRLGSEGESASVAMRQLSRYLHNLDQRYNALAFALLNGFFAWDWRQTYNLERWFSRNGARMESWQTSASHFDALSALATVRFEHPEWCMPEVDETVGLRAEDLRHPLLKASTAVGNDCPAMGFRSGEERFLVVTGANMAGKSTWLRTVGVNYLLAMIGAPVCARSMRFSPMEMYTSLRTTDSLAGGKSYFFAELQRLSAISRKADSGERLFVLLDEILRGTNSADKQRGSLGFVKRLLKRRVCGMIATHDLVVAGLEKEFPDEVKAMRFEADIRGKQLSFGYKLEPGVADRLNATFLMRELRILDEEEEE